MFQNIVPFCQIRDDRSDTVNLSKRGEFLRDLMDQHNLKYELIPYETPKKVFYNFYLWGSSSKFLTAHYDVSNVNVDNANDNSASIINALAYKLMNPSVNVVITDGEEVPWYGAGAKFASIEFKNRGILPSMILNLELTGFGEKFFIDTTNTPLGTFIKETFPDCIRIITPFNDAYIFRDHGFNSNVITTLPYKKNIDETKRLIDNLDFNILFYCHTAKDSISTISIPDMQSFVNNVVDTIIKNY